MPSASSNSAFSGNGASSESAAVSVVPPSPALPAEVLPPLPFLSRLALPVEVLPESAPAPDVPSSPERACSRSTDGACWANALPAGNPAVMMASEAASAVMRAHDVLFRMTTEVLPSICQDARAAVPCDPPWQPGERTPRHSPASTCGTRHAIHPTPELTRFTHFRTPLHPRSLLPPGWHENCWQATALDGHTYIYCEGGIHEIWKDDRDRRWSGRACRHG